MNQFKNFAAVVVTAIAAFLPSISTAASFTCVTNNTGTCSSTVAPKFSWTLVGDQLSILNNYTVTTGSFISGISFDYTAGMDVSLNATQVAGVQYTMTTGDAAKLPNSLNWTVDEGANPTKGNGKENAVHYGEKIVFTLTNVNLSQIGSAFKFGMHIQALEGGESEKLIAVSAVPETETYAMMLAGLGLMGAIVRRRKNKNA